MKNIYTIIFFLILYFIFLYYFTKNNNQEYIKKYIKINIFNKLKITSELIIDKEEIESFSNVNNYTREIHDKIYIKKENTYPKFCNNYNINCKFPIYEINKKLISINDIKKLIDSYYNYIKSLSYNEKKKYYKSIGYNSYEFINGKIFFNNIEYCNYKYGGFQKNNMNEQEVNNCNLINNNCSFKDGKYYLKSYDGIDTLCLKEKKYEIFGNLLCLTDLSLDVDEKICLPIHLYIPLLMAFCYEQKLNYQIVIDNYEPPNINEFINFLNTIKDEITEKCPKNSYSTADSCICKENYKCIGYKCENDNSFNLDECHNCSCVLE